MLGLLLVVFLEIVSAIGFSGDTDKIEISLMRGRGNGGRIVVSSIGLFKQYISN